MSTLATMSHFLKSAPFNLDSEALAWVDKTLASLSQHEKIGQLFTLASRTNAIEDQRAVLGFAPGGVFRPASGTLEQVWQANRFLVENSPVPLLFSGDIEGGGAGYRINTELPNPLGLAAADDVALSRAVVDVMAREARALGYNWSFTPLLDINATFRSAIVGTRSYGSDPAKVLKQALINVEQFREAGIATAAKHWPGEGFDDRDQHLVGTINPLSWPQWQATFGTLYSALIDAGVTSVMSAHIALPSFIREHFPDAGREAFEPASVSRLLNQRLLRQTLGFNGLIVSDATGMAGLTSWLSREALVPAVIESGCDMFLFTEGDPAIDFNYMLKGLREGRLSEQRLDEAVTRVLGLKAHLGLHRQSAEQQVPSLPDARSTIGTAASRAIAAQAASASITLVKDVPGLLPVDLNRHRRVVIAGYEQHHPVRKGPPIILAGLLEEEGFEVRAYDPQQPPTPYDTDLLVYVIAEEAVATRGHIYLDWQRLHGSLKGSLRRHWQDVPTLLISLGQPYYLYDAPLAPTSINAYSAIEPVQRALVDKLLGRSSFTAIDPVDSFCGQEVARY
ncbi:hypothetical protein LZ023_25845 [Pseudomonas silvicola]|nr:hypothetical protein LZ023_25845 [Pseudomonas silvicola]